MSETTTGGDVPLRAAVISAQTGWGAPIVSVYALTVFLVAIVVAYFAHDATLLNALLVVAATNATTVVSYWVGSSAGSQKKDATLATTMKD